jgi:putative transposase
VKDAWSAAHRQELVLVERCAARAVGISGDRAWQRGGTPDRHRLTDTRMVARIRTLHAELKRAYGSPRRVRERRARDCPASQAEMKAASFEYIEVFDNRKRMHSTLGDRSPRQFLMHWISQPHQEKLVE